MSSMPSIPWGFICFSESATDCNFIRLSLIRSRSTRVSPIIRSLAAMRVHVHHPEVFRPFFLFLGEVKQEVEAGKIRIAFDHGAGLLFLKLGQFSDRPQKIVLKPVLLCAICDLRDP